MAETAIAKEFIRVALAGETGGRRALLKIASNIETSSQGRLKDIESYFDDEETADVLEVIRAIDLYKGDYFINGNEVPEEVYEYLASYSLNVNFPDMKEQLSPKARAISDELDIYFADKQNVELPSNLETTFAGLMRIHRDLQDLYMNARINLGTKSQKHFYENYAKIVTVSMRLAQFDTALEEQVRDLHKSISFMVNAHDNHIGWYLPIAREKIGNSKDFKTDFFDELAIPRSEEPSQSILHLAKVAHIEFSQKIGLDPFDSFVYFARHYLCPLMETCNLVDKPSMTMALTAMFSSHRHEEYVREFCEDRMPAIVKMWDIYDSDTATVNQMSKETWLAVSAGHLCALMPRLQNEILKFSGGKARSPIGKNDFIIFESLITQTPSDINGHDAALTHKLLDLRKLAVETYNFQADRHGFPLLAQGSRPHHNDNSKFIETHQPN